MLQEQESAAAGCFGIEPPHTPIASLSLRVVFSLSRGRINLRRFCIEVGTGWAPPTWDSYPACSLITNVTDCPVFVKLFFAIFCAACQAWRLFAIAIFPMSHESKENNEFSHCLPINYTYRAEHVLRGKNERLSAQKPALSEVEVFVGYLNPSAEDKQPQEGAKTTITSEAPFSCTR